MHAEISRGQARTKRDRQGLIAVKQGLAEDRQGLSGDRQGLDRDRQELARDRQRLDREQARTASCLHNPYLKRAGVPQKAVLLVMGKDIDSFI